jgi:hypothetical protein
MKKNILKVCKNVQNVLLLFIAVLFGFPWWIIGIVGGMMEQIGALIEYKALVNIGVISSLIMPTDAIYRKMIFAVLSASGGAMDFLRQSFRQ